MEEVGRVVVRIDLALKRIGSKTRGALIVVHVWDKAVVST